MRSKLLLGLIVPLLLLIAWQTASSTSLENRHTFIPLNLILAGLGEVLGKEESWVNIAASLWTASSGFVVGSLLGAALGSAMALSGVVERTVSPLFNAWRPIPTLGMVPLIALWFGNGEVSKLIIVSLAAFEPMVLNTYEGLRNVDKSYLEVGKLLTFDRRRVFTKILWPAAMPSVLTGVFHALGFAWISTVGAELLFTIGPGIGGMLEKGQLAGRMEIVIACIILIGVMSFTMNHLFVRLQRRILRWRSIRSHEFSGG